MTTLVRDYYPLPLAASIIGCAIDDLIHWAANGRIRLGVLFSIDWASPDYYTCYLNDIDHPIDTPDNFQGFAYVQESSFLSMEQQGGDLGFNEVRTLGNVIIHNSPGRFEGYYGCDFRSVDGIFIHRTDLLPLMPRPAEAEKPLTTVSDNTLVATIAALFASFPPGKQPSGKDLERTAASIGISVSDDSIRKALKLAKDISVIIKPAPNRQLDMPT